MSICPSFLTLRNGIFYFQARVPSRYLREDVARTQKLIRGSTRTGNRREALHIARKWIFELMDNNYNFKTDDEIEQILDDRKKMYVRGLTLASSLQGVPDVSPLCLWPGGDVMYRRKLKASRHLLRNGCKHPRHQGRSLVVLF